MEVKCCICGRELENQGSYSYLCEACDNKYGEYADEEDETPKVQPMRKRKRYDDEKQRK